MEKKLPIAVRADRRPAYEGAPPRLRARDVEKPFVPGQRRDYSKESWYGRR